MACFLVSFFLGVGVLGAVLGPLVDFGLSFFRFRASIAIVLSVVEAVVTREGRRLCGTLGRSVCV